MDKDTRDALMKLTADVSRLSALMESHVKALERYTEGDDERDADKEKRIRKIEKWLYAIPGAYVLTLGTVVMSVMRSNGK